jgi:hypothetical protein
MARNPCNIPTTINYHRSISFGGSEQIWPDLAIDCAATRRHCGSHGGRKLRPRRLAAARPGTHYGAMDRRNDGIGGIQA